MGASHCSNAQSKNNSGSPWSSVCTLNRQIGTLQELKRPGAIERRLTKYLSACDLFGSKQQEIAIIAFRHRRVYLGRGSQPIIGNALKSFVTVANLSGRGQP